VEDITGARHLLEPRQLLSPSELTVLNLRHRWRVREERRAFENAAAQAGTPRAPASYRAGARDRVLVRWQGAWYSGVVHELEKETAFVNLLGEGRRLEIGRDALVPEPPRDYAVHRGQFALRRPGADGAPWIVVRVIGSPSEDRVRVADVTGDKQDALLRDLLPLVR
jgi:hypothetical protein